MAEPRRRAVLCGGLATVVTAACEPTRAPTSQASLGEVAALPPGLGAPQRIVIDGGRVAVVGVGGFATLAARRLRHVPVDVDGVALVTWARGGVLAGGAIRDGGGRVLRKLGGAGLYHEGGIDERVLQADAQGWTCALQRMARPRTAAMVVVRRGWHHRGWVFEAEGFGDASLDLDGAIALAMHDGRVLVLEGSVRDDAPRVLADVRVTPTPYAVAMTSEGPWLACAPGQIDPARIEQAHPDGSLRDDWRTSVVALARDGRERLRLELDFAVTQLLAQGGGVYAVGRGAAAVDARGVAWSTGAAGAPPRRGAVDDRGALVLAGDGQCARVEPGGRTVATVPLRAAPQCAPACADDRVWIVAAQRLWRARL